MEYVSSWYMFILYVNIAYLFGLQYIYIYVHVYGVLILTLSILCLYLFYYLTTI